MSEKVTPVYPNVGTVVYRSSGGSGVVMESAVKRDGIVSVLWEDADDIAETPLNELMPIGEALRSSMQEDNGDTLTLKEKVEIMMGLGILEEIQEFKQLGISPQLIEELNHEQRRNMESILDQRLRREASGNEPSCASFGTLRSKLSLLGQSDPQFLDFAKEGALELLSSDQIATIEAMMDQSLTTEDITPVELSSDFPESSILKYFGIRPICPFARGDIVQRSVGWKWGNQDGGPGRTGLVENVDVDGFIWVRWKQGVKNKYSRNDLLVVGFVKDINIGDIVERGPDWMFSDQDGGHGTRGIVMQFAKFGLEVICKWENGTQANYRWGYAHDVKVVKTSREVQSEVDMLSDAICPIAWDEMSILKQSNNESGVLVIGDFVTRGPHWNKSIYGDQDGGEDTVGIVRMVDDHVGRVSVEWFKTEKEYAYQYCSNDDTYEVSLILTRCPGKAVKYKHWQSRCISVPSECDISTFVCKLCRNQCDHLRMKENPPFYCTLCCSCICLKCYHDRKPPKCFGIKSRFSLEQSRRILKLYSPTLSESDIDKALGDAGGDVEVALENIVPVAISPAIRTSKVKSIEEVKIDKLRYIAAIQSGNLDDVRNIGISFDINSCIQGQRTPLHIAAGYGEHNVVKYLLTVGANCNALDEVADGPLAYATQSGHAEVVGLLLERGADVNSMNKNGISALFRAVSTDRVDIIDMLIAGGAALDVQDLSGRTAVHVAVAHDYAGALVKLLENGSSCNIADNNKWCPLHLCGKMKSYSCCKALLDHGADPTVGDESGSLPLHIASAFNAVDVMNTILDHFPEVIDCVDEVRRSALHIACMIVRESDADTSETRGEEAALELISRGIDVGLKDSSHYTPIIYAAKSGLAATVRTIAAKDKYYLTAHCGDELLTPLLAACSRNMYDVAQILLQENEVDVNATDKNGNTSLHLAAACCGVESAQLLLTKSALIDVRNSAGQTPLHVAAAKGAVDMLEVFLNHSTLSENILNSQDAYGDTALHDAVTCENEDIARLLLKSGADCSIVNNMGRTAINVSKLKSANIRSLMNVEAPILGAAIESRRILERNDVIQRVRQEFPIGKEQCPELEAALSDNFSDLQEMREYFLSMAEDGRNIFCSELVKSLNIKKIRIKTKIISFLPRFISELVSSPQGMDNLVSPREVLGRPVSFDEVTAPTITWKKLLVDLTEDCTVGFGSYSVVIRCKYAPHGKKNHTLDVVVKVMTSRFKNPELKLECIREKAWMEANTMYRAGLSIQSDAVVKVHGIVEGPLPSDWKIALRHCGDDHFVGIVMKYESGGSLESLIHSKLKREISMTEKIRILRGIAVGISELHSMPIEYYIVHGDIKPGNVLLGHQSPCSVKLADFGMSDFKESIMSSCQMSVLRSTQTRRGTPVYSAPELLPSPSEMKISSPSRSSDMYAFGILAWEFLSGVRPFEDVSNEFELIMTVHGGGRPDFSKLPAHTPPDVVEMIRACFRADRKERMSADECFVLLDVVYMRLSTNHFDIFFSHPWADKSFLKHVFAILASAGYRVWYDVLDMKWNLDESMSDGIKNSSAVLACVNTTYQQRANCLKELKMATSLENPKKPVVCLVTESEPFSWATEELKALCSFQTNMYCDVGEVAKLGATAWENPTEVMLSELQMLLQPLFRILNELNIEKSLLTGKL